MVVEDEESEDAVEGTAQNDNEASPTVTPSTRAQNR